MISAGLEGMPRRIFRAQATYNNPAWDLGGILTGVGGTLMFIGIMLFFLVIGVTAFFGKRRTAAEVMDVPVSETLTAPAMKGWERSLDKVWFWVLVAIALIIVAYGPFFLQYTPWFVSPGYRFF
jgi:cytochrome c oxidase subunit I